MQTAWKEAVYFELYSVDKTNELDTLFKIKTDTSFHHFVISNQCKDWIENGTKVMIKLPFYNVNQNE